LPNAKGPRKMGPPKKGGKPIWRSRKKKKKKEKKGKLGGR